MKKKYFISILSLLLLFFALDVSAAITNPAPGIFADLAGGNTFANLFIFITRRLLEVAGILAVLFLVIGGFQYITSGANQELAETGKKTVRNAIIGLTVIILSYIIVTVIINALITIP